MSLFLSACGSDSVTGLAAETCGAPPYFTVLPVPQVDLSYVPVLGGMDAPGHVLPTDHGAFFLVREKVPLRAPGNIVVTDLRRVRYSGPDVPPGEEDYAIFFSACREVSGWFGHVSSLAPGFSPSTVTYTNCRTYSVIWADVETCEARVNIELMAGDDLGTGGPVMDFGVIDERVTNFYVSPHRIGGPNHAVCMWEYFDPTNRALLFSRIRDTLRPEVVPAGEPRCGTMEVDVAGTAKGVWAEVGVGPVAGDERGYIALADYPYRPQQELALSLGPASLGARVAIVTKEASGRVNRAFQDVVAGGGIYCYGPQTNGSSTSSWFLQVTSSTALRIEHIEHGPGTSPCGDEPGTWAFGSTAVTMVR
jgi:hypothetical protein